MIATSFIRDVILQVKICISQQFLQSVLNKHPCLGAEITSKSFWLRVPNNMHSSVHFCAPACLVIHLCVKYSPNLKLTPNPSLSDPPSLAPRSTFPLFPVLFSGQHVCTGLTWMWADIGTCASVRWNHMSYLTMLPPCDPLKESTSFVTRTQHNNLYPWDCGEPLWERERGGEEEKLCGCIFSL